MVFQLGALQTSSKGVRSCPVSLGGHPIVRELGSKRDPLSCAYNASSFTAGDKRMSLMLLPTASVAEWVRELDVWCQQHVQENDQLFKGKKREYKPLIREDGAIRCKCTAPPGRNTCTFWDEHCQSMDMPEDFTQVSIVPRVHLKCMWAMGTQCGLCLEITAMQVLPEFRRSVRAYAV